MPKAQLKMDLIVDDKGSVVIKGFSDKTARYLGDGAKAVQGFTSRLLSMQNVLIGLAGGYTLSKIATEALDVASSFEQMEVKLDALTKGRGADTLERINAWALEMPVNTRKAVDTFAMMQAMGLDPTITKMQTLVDVSSIFSEDAMPRVARALGQMKTLGKLSAEELNQMAEAGINARKYLTQAFGKTVEELQKSKHSIDEIIDAIWKGLDADFGGAAKKAQDSWKGMTATFKSYLEEIARQVMEAGIFDEMKTQLKGINEELSEWLKTNEGIIKQNVPEYIRNTKEALQGIWDVISYDPAIIEWGLVGLAFGGRKGAIIMGSLGHMKEWVENLSAAMGLVSSGMVDISEVATANFTELKELVESFGNLDALQALEKQAKGLREEIEHLQKVTQGQLFWFRGDKERLQEAKEQLKEVNQQIDTMRRNLSWKAEWETINKEIDRYAATIKKSTGNFTTLNKKVKELSKSHSMAGQEAEDLLDVYRQINDALYMRFTYDKSHQVGGVNDLAGLFATAEADPLAGITGFVWEDFIARGRGAIAEAKSEAESAVDDIAWVFSASFKEAFDGTQSLWESLWDNMADYALNQAIKDISDGFKDLLDDFEMSMESLYDSLGSLGSILITSGLGGGSKAGKIGGSVGGMVGQAAGTYFFGPAGGMVGGWLGSAAGSLIGSAFGGNTTSYGEASPGRLSYGPEGFELAGILAAASGPGNKGDKSGGRYAADLRRYAEEVLDDYARIISKLPEELQAQVESRLSTLDISLGYTFGSGFQGFSSPLTDEYQSSFQVATDQIASWLAPIEDILKEYTDAVDLMAEAAEEVAEITDSLRDYTNLMRTLADEHAKAAKQYGRIISDINNQMISDLRPWESLRASAAGNLNAHTGWDLSDYTRRFTELTRKDQASLDVLQEQYDVLKSIERLTQQEVSQTEALVNSLGDTILRLTGGDLAPVQSAGFFGSRYTSLLGSARTGDREAAEDFNAFVSEYLGFMGSYGDDYKSLAQSVLKDLSGLESLYDQQGDLATNQMLLETSISTNELLKAIIAKADEQIAAIRADAAAQTAAAGAARNAEISSAISALKSSVMAQGITETQFEPYASALVKSFYQEYLNRAPDAGGYAGWVNALTSGQLSAHGVQQGFFQSDEYKSLYGGSIAHGTGLPLNFDTWARSYLGLAGGGETAGVNLVGESGPEILISKSGGRVVSHNDSMRAIEAAVTKAMMMPGSGGGETHVHLHLDGKEIARSVVRNGRGMRDVKDFIRHAARAN